MSRGIRRGVLGLLFISLSTFVSPKASAVAPIDLEAAADFAVLAGSGITIAGSVNSTTFTGSIGSSPLNSITGSENARFVTGVNHDGDGVTVAAKASLLHAYNDAADRSATNVYAPIFDLGGLTVRSGVHKNPSSFGITGTLTLDGLGDPNAVWIFQMGSTLTTGANSQVNLINGALASNVFWQVGTSATLGAGSDFSGSILAFTSITLNSGATVDGRLLAINGAVTLINNSITVVKKPDVVDSVEFPEGSELEVEETLTVESGIFEVPTGGTAITGGVIIVPGDFTKNGIGDLVTNTTFQIGGTAFVTEGGLYVNGTLQAAQVNVLPQAVFGGSGLVISNVVNAGTTSPGFNGAGTFIIDGDFTQTSGGTLLISGETGGTSFVVNGAAQLDGTLDLRNLSGIPSDYGDEFIFLEADSITGDFDEILMPDNGSVRGRFIVSGNDGVLLIAPSSYTLVAQTPNQTRVARALDQWIGNDDEDIAEITLALDQLSENEYPQAFEAIMPGYYASLMSTGIELSQNQGQLLHQQLSSRRLGKRSKPQVQDEAPRQPDNGKYAKQVQPVAPQVAIRDEDRWNVWVQASGTFSEGGMSLTPGEDFESGEIMVGSDYAINEHFSLGIFASYQEGYADYYNGGSIDLESVRVGVYATADFGGFYLHGAAGVGSTEYDVKRPIQFDNFRRTAQSKPDGSEYFVLLGTGYDFHAGNFTFGPSASAQYTRLNLNGFTERGADSLNLRVDDTSMDSLRTYLGGRVAYTHKINDHLTLIPEFRVFWQHEFMQGEENIQAALDNGNGPGFNYLTEESGKDSVYAGVGASLLIGENVSVSLYYHANVGRNDDAQHIITAALNWKF